MGTAAERLAIILHGPPGVGKSTVCGELTKNLSSVTHASLDQGWSMTERPAKKAVERYADLRSVSEDVLIVTLACGEPEDLKSRGATRGAADWVSVLRGAGRQVMPFLLWAEWREVICRLTERHGSKNRWDYNAFMSQCGVYALYTQNHELVTFPKIDGFVEQRVVTEGRTAAEVANEILLKVKSSDGLPGR